MKKERETPESQLLNLLLDTGLYDRPPLLIARLVDLFSSLPRPACLRFFKKELGHPARPLHFQHVLLESAIQLAWVDLLEPLQSYILSAAPIQLVKSAMNAVAATRSLGAYRFFRELAVKCNRPEIVDLARGRIEILTAEVQLIKRFDALINGLPAHRNPYTGIDTLAEQLDVESRQLLLLPLQQLIGDELAALARLIGLCGDRIFTGPLLKRLQLDWTNLADEALRELLGALAVCARSSGKDREIGQALSRLFTQTPKDRRERVMIWSWPLLEEQDRVQMLNRFWVMGTENKRVLIDVLGREGDPRLAPLLLSGLEREDDDQLFETYLTWLLEHGHGRACLDRSARMNSPRRHLLLCGLGQGDCEAYVDDLLPWFHPGEDDDLLVCLAAGLLKTESPGAALRAWEMMRSGVSSPVLSALIRRLPDWLMRVNLPLDEVFAVARRERDLLPEWLVAWGRILEKTEDPERRMALFDGILVLFEDLAGADILHFIEFFRRTDFRSREECRLVKMELQMILNTLLKSPVPSSETRRLAELLRDLDRLEARWRVE